MGVRVPSLLPKESNLQMKSTNFPKYSEELLFEMFKQWFTNNYVQSSRSCSLSLAHTDFQLWNFAHIDLDLFKIYLELYGVEIVNDTIFGIQLL